MQPDCIRLNRGNHESRQQNKIMGFEEEVCDRLTCVDRRNEAGTFEHTWKYGLLLVVLG